MKNKIIIATHGRFASGILQSAELILGKQDDIAAICCYVEKGIDYANVINNEIDKALSEYDQLIVITDLLGGSVNNEFVKRINEKKLILLTGLSLPLLLEILNARNNLNIQKAEEIATQVGSYTMCCNSKILEFENDDL